MKNLTLQQKIVIPMLGGIALIALALTWYIVTKQNRSVNTLFREELHTLANSTGMMTHPAAEEIVQSKGFRFHRASLSLEQNKDGLDEFKREAVQAFHSDPTLPVYINEVAMNDTRHLIVFAPIKLRSECVSCHVNSGLTMDSGKKDGELVAIFGVSGSLKEILAEETNTIIVALLVTAFIVGIIGWCIHYFLKSTLLVPCKNSNFNPKLLPAVIFAQSILRHLSKKWIRMMKWDR